VSTNSLYIKGCWQISAPQEEKEKLFAHCSFEQFSDSSSADWFMSWKNNYWTLADRNKNKLQINFDAENGDYDRQVHRGKKETLAKAIGVVPQTMSIVDATAGLGQDAVFLATLGYHVHAFERHPLVYFLLHQAKQQTMRPELSGLKIYFGNLNNENLPHNTKAIYFDPMYPQKKKSALSRQEMQIFKKLVGEDLDSFETAQVLKTLSSRFVIKRPLKAPSLLPGPTHGFKGSTVRYDIYTQTRSTP
jgi:16S rRNA (guanine1516-N2)-methyltransferase